MKSVKVLALCALLAVSGQSFAKTTPIVFAKGSYCGSFEGDVVGRRFTLGLMKHQTLFVNPTDRSQYEVIVKNPKGQTLKNNGGSMSGWDIPQNGKYTIIITPFNKGDSYANIEFCAY
ncbi:MAG: hypothetical protein Q4B79_05280 [Moraxella sp.]|uniref:hypothetical protein n=1 Tax=Moraxella sp. TaxID=479 RepID=UPI0026DC8A81|nr:hypothetical protein [Moraxella sp.]MDO4450355.1 hypothetical protein [Moraxella sp.]